MSTPEIPTYKPRGRKLPHSYFVTKRPSGVTSGWCRVEIYGEGTLALPAGITPDSVWWNRSTINGLWWFNGKDRWSCVHSCLLERHGNLWQVCAGSTACEECGDPDLPPYTQSDVDEAARRAVALLEELERHG